MNAKEIASRLRSQFKLKALLSLALSFGVFGSYLLLQRHPLFPAIEVKSFGLDRAIPFWPSSAYLYESVWLLMPIAPWLMDSKEELCAYTRGIVLVAMTAFAVFLCCPTSCPRPQTLEGANALYSALIQIDRDLNACPSLHAAFAVFHAAWCYWLFAASAGSRRFRWFIWAWAAGIILSTLLIKQHVIVDAAAGALLGAGGYVFATRAHGIIGRPGLNKRSPRKSCVSSI